MNSGNNGTAPPLVPLWINGTAVDPEGADYLDDLCPLDDRVLARAAAARPSDVLRAVAAASEAFATFRHSTPRQREAWMNRAADLLLEREAELVEVLIDEVGATLMKARYEVRFAADAFRAAAGVARHVTGQTLPSDVPGRVSLSFREPIGVIACITPFNVPLLKGAKLASVPLATGNTVVLLPSEEAPLIAHHLARLLADAGVPPGAFNVVSGRGEQIGDTLTTAPEVRAVSFTGSTRVGRHIRALAGQHGKRVLLELGGKNPLVVLADADLPAAVQGAVFGNFVNQGQVCLASTRIYVQRPVYRDFLQAFRKATETLGMGDQRRSDTMIGPIINRRQRDRVRSHIEDALSKGAELVTGGTWDGHRCRPTILAGVTPAMAVFAQETFGPVASVYAVDTFEEALAAANATEYGLSASIYTRNLSHALRFAREIRSGMVHINAPSNQDEPHVPFGGNGDSGYGREGTSVDIDFLTEWKWVTVQL